MTACPAIRASAARRHFPGAKTAFEHTVALGASIGRHFKNRRRHGSRKGARDRHSKGKTRNGFPCLLRPCQSPWPTALYLLMPPMQCSRLSLSGLKPNNEALTGSLWDADYVHNQLFADLIRVADATRRSCVLHRRIPGASCHWLGNRSGQRGRRIQALSLAAHSKF